MHDRTGQTLTELLVASDLRHARGGRPRSSAAAYEAWHAAFPDTSAKRLVDIATNYSTPTDELIPAVQEIQERRSRLPLAQLAPGYTLEYAVHDADQRLHPELYDDF